MEMTFVAAACGLEEGNGIGSWRPVVGQSSTLARDL
jgi:hypothetical protein